MDQSKILLFSIQLKDSLHWKADLNIFTNRQDFRLVKMKGICRQRNECDSKLEICFGKDRKYYGNRHFLLFPQCFEKL